MAIFLDERGALRSSRGPAPGPILSLDARRLAAESPPSVGSAPGRADDGGRDGPADPGMPPDPAPDAPGDPGWPIEPQSWAASQFAAARLGDSRRTARLVRLAAQVARDPGSSLPAQADSWADLKAAYRLLARPEATPDAITAPHRRLTRSYAGGDRLLLLDDTTEVSFGPGRRAADLGPVGRGTSRGFLLHSALAVDPRDGWVAGLAGQVPFHRRPAPKGETATQKGRRGRESAVWGQLIEQVGPPPEGARWVHVMDRGCDDFEVFCRARRVGVDWVGRVKSRNRLVRDASGAAMPLSGLLAAAPAAGGYALELRARPGQPARRAKVEVSFAAATTPVPRRPPASLLSLDPSPIGQWAVRAREVDPPAGLRDPIDWVLLTSLGVSDLAGAIEVVGYYEARWLIEEWHKVLKTGCGVERRQLQSGSALGAMAGLLSVVAVRLLQMRELGRRQPGVPAKGLVPDGHLELVHRAGRGRGRAEDWTIRDFLRGLAGLGGFLGRRGDGEPGWVTIWRGWQKLNWMLRGARLVDRPPDW